MHIVPLRFETALLAAEAAFASSRRCTLVLSAPGPSRMGAGMQSQRTSLLKEVNAEFKPPRPHLFVEIISDQPRKRMCS